MEAKEFKITINAPREKVWSTLWNDSTYREWTSAFGEGSSAKTDWKKGSKALFVDPENSGMVSTIAENIPNEFMSIKHLGIIIKGVEDMNSEQAREWSGGLENYTLQTVNGKTELTINIDIAPGFEDYFMDAWPKALERLREIAEKN